jgi:low temperature requirement protein LtrA
MSPSSSLLRRRDHADAGRVGAVELFFDLVFVFAVTQLSHTLLADLSLSGLLQVVLLLLAVWWAWIYTSWVTNWLDPERIPVRLCLFALMLLGLVMSMSIPAAFGKRGLAFAGAYVLMQGGRNVFFLWAVHRDSESLTRTFQRILVWVCASAVFWLAGAFAEGRTRMLCWLVALSIEFVGPWLYFRVPGLGRSTTTEWNVHGGHLAERCGLFVIIALGESLLVTGATFAGLSWDFAGGAAFVVAVLGSVLLWWIYFDTGAELGHRRIALSADPGRLARLGYSYLHILIIAGIIVCAVADEVVLMHPGHATSAAYAVIVGGPACYLVGTMFFKWVTNDRRAPPLSHLVGLGMLALLAWFAYALRPSALRLSIAATGALAVVAAWESVALRIRPRG